MSKIPPLRAKTMTLEELQRETLKLCRSVRKHLTFQDWKNGRSDAEFTNEVVNALETRIKQDIEMQKLAEENEVRG